MSHSSKSRRDFVFDGVATVAASFLTPLSAFAVGGGDRLIVAGMNFDPATRQPVDNRRDGTLDHFVVILNPKTKIAHRVKVPFAPHSVFPHPGRAGIVLAVPNDPDKGVVMEVSIPEKKLLRTVEGFEKSGFYGHGLFSPDASELLLTEYEKGGDTVITRRDPNSYKLLGHFPAHGNMPHEMNILPGDKELIVCHHATAAIVHIKSGRLVRKIEPLDPEQAMAHVVVAKDGTIFLLATVADAEPRTKNGEIYALRGKEGKLVALKSPKGFIGQALSGVVDEEARIFAATHQHCDKVSVWSLDSLELIGSVDVPHQPRGICVHPASKALLVSNLKGDLYQVEYPSKVKLVAQAEDGIVGNNAHLTLLR